MKHRGDSWFLLSLSLILVDSQILLGSFSVVVCPWPLGIPTYEVLGPSELLAMCAGNKEAKIPVVTYLLDLLMSSPKRNLLEMSIGSHDVCIRASMPFVVSFGSLLS